MNERIDSNTIWQLAQTVRWMKHDSRENWDCFIHRSSYVRDDSEVEEALWRLYRAYGEKMRYDENWGTFDGEDANIITEWDEYGEPLMTELKPEVVAFLEAADKEIEDAENNIDELRWKRQDEERAAREAEDEDDNEE